MLDSSSQPNFQESYSFFSVTQIQNEQSSILKMNMKLLREFEKQSQNMMDSRLHHNFQNQLSYSPSQEEPIAKSMEEMIQTQNSVTRPISRLDSIMSEMINENEENLFCQPLTNPYISNSIDWTQESCYFRNQDSISAHLFEFDQTLSFENHIDILASYHLPEIEIELKVILNLKLVIPFHFLTQ